MGPYRRSRERLRDRQCTMFLWVCGDYLPILVLAVGCRRVSLLLLGAAAGCFYGMELSQSLLCHLPCRESLAPWLPKVRSPARNTLT